MQTLSTKALIEGLEREILNLEKTIKIMRNVIKAIKQSEEK